MRKIILSIVCLLLAAGGWWTYKKLFPGDEVKIRRVLDQLAQSASFAGSQKPLSQLSSAADLANCFTSDVEIKLNVPYGGLGSIRGRDHVQQLAMAARSRVGSLSVRFEDIAITVAEDKRSADAQLIGIAQGTGDAGMQEPFHQELKLQLRKVDGKWFVSRVETVQAVRRVD